MRYPFWTADVFTDGAFAGNPLAVVADASGLTTQQMQAIAHEVNLSETTFVLPPEKPEHTFRLRIFTPAEELPFAGHPTVGSAFVLAHAGRIQLKGDKTSIVFGENVGPVRPSRMEVEADAAHGALTAVRVAGPSVVMSEGHLQL